LPRLWSNGVSSTLRSLASRDPLAQHAGTSERERLRAALALFFVVTVLFNGFMPARGAANDIDTVAGIGSSGGDGGPATSALLRSPNDMAMGPDGSIYIADTWNHRIRVVSPAGTITTFAGLGESGYSGDGGPATSARFSFPYGIVVDPAGNVYFSDNENAVIRRVDAATGVITTVAGNGTEGFSGDGGAATEAMLNTPRGLALHPTTGDLYIADTLNNRVRKVVLSTGIITTVAGDGGSGSGGDGNPATSADMKQPSDVAFDTAGNLYIADSENHRIRKVDTNGIITKFAGDGSRGFSGDGGDSLRAKMDSPTGIAIDANGVLYIADSDNNRIRKVASNIMTTYAGNGAGTFAGDGGAAIAAGLSPEQVTIGPNGSVLIADTWNHRIRRVNVTGNISTIAGAPRFSGDGGPASQAALNWPVGVTISGSAEIIVTDYLNNRVRKVAPSGTITTIAGTTTAGAGGDGGPATSAQLNLPADVAVKADGTIFVADSANNKVRKISSGGTITTYTGTGSAGNSGDNGAATSARLNNPSGLDLDPAGNLYIADSKSHRIRKVNTSGLITRFAGDSRGSSGDGGNAVSAKLNNPVDVAVAPDGSVYIADYGNHKIRKVSPSGIISTVAGTGTAGYSGDGGPGTSAQLSSPAGVAVDPVGNVYIADGGNNRIRRLDTAGVITTVAGTGASGYSGDGGPAVNASMMFPARVALDAEGNFYLADTLNDRIRRVEALGDLPAPTILGSTPGSPANDNSPKLYGSSDTGTTVSIYTTPNCSSAAVASGSAAQFASPGFNVGVANDSTTSFYARATDASGNVSQCSSRAYVFVEDSQAPTVTIDSAPPSPSGDAIPSWTFTKTPGSQATCQLTRGATTLSPYGACTSPFTFDLTAEIDGNYTFSVRTTDAAGNVSQVASDDYSLDRSGPEATINASPSSPASDVTPEWGFTTEAGTSGQCRLSRGAVVISDYAACTSPVSFDLTASGEGLYALDVRAVDGVGVTGYPDTAIYELDLTGPTVAFTSNPGAVGGDLTPTWVFDSELGAATQCRLYKGVQVVYDWNPCTNSVTFDLGTQSDATYTAAVRASDPAGNTTTISHEYTLDSAGPSVDIVSGPGSTGIDRTPSWTFTTEGGATTDCWLKFDDVLVLEQPGCTSPVTFDLTSEPDGNYSFFVDATDAGGNKGSVSSSDYALQTEVPTVTITSSPVTPGNSTSVGWSFDLSLSATDAECRLERGATVLSDFTSCTSPAVYDVSGSTDGVHTFTVRPVNGAVRGTARSSAYTLDRIGPVITIGQRPSDIDTDRTPTWAFSTENGAVMSCELNGDLGVIETTANCSSPKTYDLSSEGAGVFIFTVQATDAAGNTGAMEADSFTLQEPEPTPSPTPTVEPTPSTEPTPTAEPTPTVEPTPSQEPTEEPSPEPDPTEEPEEPREPGDGGGGAPPPEAPDPGDPTQGISDPIPADPVDPQQEPAMTHPNNKTRSVVPGLPTARELAEDAAAPVELVEKVETISGPSLPEGSKPKTPGLVSQVTRAAADVVKGSAFPGTLVFMVFAFLMLQDRLDRADPKLALAPVNPDPYLDFRPG
jgi:trimeric autotransporter adhesin